MADRFAGFAPKNITLTNPDQGSTDICMPVFPGPLLFKLTPGRFPKKIFHRA
jgi:hypothetical protein